VYSQIETPITIGREASNAVPLNDESISRYHAKIQEDQGRIILTDLGSTNGTRVNGHPVQLKVLKPGDHLHIGRCILLYGSFREIEESLAHSSGDGPLRQKELGRSTKEPFKLPDAVEDVPEETHEVGLELFPAGCPELPSDMTLIQRAQMSDLLAFMHNRLVLLMSEAYEDSDGAERDVRIPWHVWQKILRTEMELSQALQEICEPG
jgi:hypothetical protein